MVAGKKRAVRPNLGNSLRPPTDTPRHRFLYTDVTKTERHKILRHCKKRQISVSQFLADLMLQDARKPRRTRKQKLNVQVELEMTAEELDKLQLLARLSAKQSIEHFVREILQPYLEVQRLHSPLETTTLRYYLSEAEHEKVTRHLANKGISARNYAAMLALKAVETT